MNTPTTLADFLQLQLTRRGWSARELAARAGISHSTLNRFLDPNNQYHASPTVLIQIAEALDVNPLTLMVLAYPGLETGVKKALNITRDTLLLSEMIEKLPANIRDAVKVLVYQHIEIGEGNKHSNTE